MRDRRADQPGRNPTTRRLVVGADRCRLAPAHDRSTSAALWPQTARCRSAFSPVSWPDAPWLGTRAKAHGRTVPSIPISRRRKVTRAIKFVSQPPSYAIYSNPRPALHDVREFSTVNNLSPKEEVVSAVYLDEAGITACTVRSDWIERWRAFALPRGWRHEPQCSLSSRQACGSYGQSPS